MNTSADIIEISDPKALPNKPLVSVYMLTYNHERFISDAIEGVIAQQCTFPIELIIGEDCSLDNTCGIVIDYQRRYPHLIRVLTSAKNMRAYANAMRCVSAARGKYIAICEGDDYWHNSQKLQIQIDAMRADKTISLCHTDFDRRIGGKISRSVYAQRQPKYLAKDSSYFNLLHQWSVITATSVYRADVMHQFMQSKFNRSDWPFGDYNKALFASTQGVVLYLPISTATWRKVPGSAGNSGLRDKVRLAIAGVECREEFLHEYPLPPDVAKEILSFSYNRLMKDAFIIGDHALHNYCRNQLKYHTCHVNEIKYNMQFLIMKSKLLHALFHAAYGAYDRIINTKLAKG